MSNTKEIHMTSQPSRCPECGCQGRYGFDDDWCHDDVRAAMDSPREGFYPDTDRIDREYPDGVHTCAELQRLEPGRRPCTCGRCGAEVTSGG